VACETQEGRPAAVIKKFLSQKRAIV